MKQLPKALANKLRVYNWTEYAGDNPLYQGFWAKQGIAIQIHPAKKITKMFHVTVMRDESSTTKFIHEDELNQIIETE